MCTIDIHEAETCLSRLVRNAVSGEPFIITIAGKPMVKVTSVAAGKTGTERRIGFMAGQINIPDDFNRMSPAKIET